MREVGILDELIPTTVIDVIGGDGLKFSQKSTKGEFAVWAGRAVVRPYGLYNDTG